MKRLMRFVAVGFCLLPVWLGSQVVQNPYQSLGQRVETQLRFTTDVAFPGGPDFQVKVYDWVIGPRQEILSFPLEGFATIEVKSGELETTINGVTSTRREGQHFAVPEGARLDIAIRADTGRGDNIVSLHGVVAIRRR
jgi:hypothetical protein